MPAIHLQMLQKSKMVRKSAPKKSMKDGEIIESGHRKIHGRIPVVMLCFRRLWLEKIFQINKSYVVVNEYIYI